MRNLASNKQVWSSDKSQCWLANGSNGPLRTERTDIILTVDLEDVFYIKSVRIKWWAASSAKQVRIDTYIDENTKTSSLTFSQPPMNVSGSSTFDNINKLGGAIQIYLSGRSPDPFFKRYSIGVNSIEVLGCHFFSLDQRIPCQAAAASLLLKIRAAKHMETPVQNQTVQSHNEAEKFLSWKEWAKLFDSRNGPWKESGLFSSEPLLEQSESHFRRLRTFKLSYRHNHENRLIKDA